MKIKRNRMGWNKGTGLVRNLVWAWQRLHRGWDDRAIFNTDYYTSLLMLDLLPRYKVIGGIPGIFYWTENGEEILDDVAEKAWHEILDKMILGFEASVCLVDNCDYDADKDWKIAHDKFVKEMDDGLRLFAEYFGELWT